MLPLLLLLLLLMVMMMSLLLLPWLLLLLLSVLPPLLLLLRSYSRCCCCCAPIHAASTFAAITAAASAVPCLPGKNAQVATVTTEYVAPETPAAPAAEEEPAPAPSPAGAGVGGGGKPVSAELVMQQVRAVCNGGRFFETIVCSRVRDVTFGPTVLLCQICEEMLRTVVWVLLTFIV